MNTDTIKYLSTKETERLLSRISSKRDKAMFALMYFYGMRCVEAAKLNLDDLRLADSRLYIHAAKNGISGEVILTREVRRVLEAYVKERGSDTTQARALFVSRKSKTGSGRLSTRQISRLFQKYAKHAKLPIDKQHPHVLRHSIAVHMADSGIDVGVVKDHLRHRKIENTMIYFQITSKKRHEFQARALAGEFVARI